MLTGVAVLADPGGEVARRNSAPSVVGVVRVDGGVRGCVVFAKVEHSTTQGFHWGENGVVGVAVSNGFALGTVLLVGEEQQCLLGLVYDSEWGLNGIVSVTVVDKGDILEPEGCLGSGGVAVFAGAKEVEVAGDGEVS